MRAQLLPGRRRQVSGAALHRSLPLSPASSGCGWIARAHTWPADCAPKPALSPAPPPPHGQPRPQVPELLPRGLRLHRLRRGPRRLAAEVVSDASAVGRPGAHECTVAQPGAHECTVAQPGAHEGVRAPPAAARQLPAAAPPIPTPCCRRPPSPPRLPSMTQLRVPPRLLRGPRHLQVRLLLDLQRRGLPLRRVHRHRLHPVGGWGAQHGGQRVGAAAGVGMKWRDERRACRAPTRLPPLPHLPSLPARCMRGVFNSATKKCAR